MSINFSIVHFRLESIPGIDAEKKKSKPKPAPPKRPELTKQASEHVYLELQREFILIFLIVILIVIHKI